MSGLFDQKTERDSLYQRNDAYGSGLGILQRIEVSLDSSEPEKFHADAVAKGNSIFLSTGAEGLLRHELGHVIQQRCGSVPATRYMAGQKVNDSAAMEREADRLGNMIPPHMVKRVLSDAGRGGIVRSVQGVVQCGKKTFKKADTGQRVASGAGQRASREEMEVNHIISQLQIHMGELQAIKGEKKNTKNKQERIREKQGEIEECRKSLVRFLNSLYEGHDKLIQSLVTQIERGNYNPITLPLIGHLYEGRSIHSSSTGEATGLHAYSDLYQGKENLLGMLPPQIKPLGYIGDRSQVHILHWTLEGEEDPNKTKFSTMLPNTMPEVISKLLFGAASQNVVGTDFGEIRMGGSGETMFPLGDGIPVTRDLPEDDPHRYIRRGELPMEFREDPDRLITLTDIYTAFNPDQNGTKVLDARDYLIDLGVYHVWEGM